MKFLLSLTVLSLLFGFSARADLDLGPLWVHPPDGWDVAYDAANGVPHYTLTRSDGENVQFTFSHWSAPGSQKEIPDFLDSLAERFQEAAKKSPKIKLASDTYTKGEFIGDPFSGQFVIFALDGGLMQTIFMFSDGNGIWNGQYTGSSARWLEALEILKGVKKRH